MGGEALALDPERARALAAACAEVSAAAGGLGADVESLLSAAQQHTRAAGLLSEVHRELALVNRVILGTVDDVEAADRWVWSRLLDTGQRLLTRHSERALWVSLTDSDGATALDLGVFDLASSFVTIGVADWRGAMIPPGCEGFGTGRYYSGGGAIRGPDDRLYPIVVPHLEVDREHHYTADADPGGSTPSVGSLGGGDPGWDLIGYRTGVERIESAPTQWSKIVTGIAVATGLDIGASVDAGQLTGIHLRAGSRAQFSATAPGLTPVDMSVTTDGSAVASPESPVAAGLLSLAIGAATGYIAARDLDDRRHRAYEVMFEQHADGRLRARVQTFTLEIGARGVGLYGWHLFLDADGDLHQSPISYPAVESIHPPDVLFAGNPYDPDHTWRLPNADFDGNPE